MSEMTKLPALELGKAAEHIVCAKAILAGYRAFLSDQGLPYDVIIDVDGLLLRTQVKATCYARNCGMVGRPVDMKYWFDVRKRGSLGNKRLSDTDCDLVALVALDCMEVAFLPLADCGQSVQLFTQDKVFRVNYPRRKGRIDQYPLACALEAMKNPVRTLFKDEHRVEYGGRRDSLASFATERGLPASVVHGRVNRGWSLADALETPAMRPGQKRARR